MKNKYTVLKQYNTYSPLNKEIFKDLLEDIILSVKVSNWNHTPENIDPRAAIYNDLFIEWCNNYRKQLIEREDNIDEFLKQQMDVLFEAVENEFSDDKQDMFFVYLEKGIWDVDFDMKWKDQSHLKEIRWYLLYLLEKEKFLQTFKDWSILKPSMELMNDPWKQTIMTPLLDSREFVFWPLDLEDIKKDSESKMNLLKTWSANVIEIEELLNFLVDQESSEVTYNDWSLYYKWEEFYKPRGEYSDRAIFIKLMFSKEKWYLFSFKEILEELEWPWVSLTKKFWKKIYNLRDQLNPIIEKETGDSNFFKLRESEFESKISR